MDFILFPSINTQEEFRKLMQLAAIFDYFHFISSDEVENICSNYSKSDCCLLRQVNFFHQQKPIKRFMIFFSEIW